MAFNLKVNVGHSDISWASDFAIYLEDFLMDEQHNLG